MKDKFPPALCLLGRWEINEAGVPQDQQHGLELLQKAAAKNSGPALFSLERLEMEGKLMARNPEEGLPLIREAAVLGSDEAQFVLGNKYSKGGRTPSRF